MSDCWKKPTRYPRRVRIIARTEQVVILAVAYQADATTHRYNLLKAGWVEVQRTYTVSHTLIRFERP